MTLLKYLFLSFESHTESLSNSFGHVQNKLTSGSFPCILCVPPDPHTPKGPSITTQDLNARSAFSLLNHLQIIYTLFLES